MIHARSLRRLGVIGIPLAALPILFVLNLVRPVFETQSVVTFIPHIDTIADELKNIRANDLQKRIAWLDMKSTPTLILDHRPLSSDLTLVTHAASAFVAWSAAKAAAQLIIDDSLRRQKTALMHLETDNNAQALALNARRSALAHERDNAVALLHSYSHRRRRRTMHPALSDRVQTVSRELIELQMRESLLDQRRRLLMADQRGLASQWRLRRPAIKPSHPIRIQGWPLAAETTSILFILCFMCFKDRHKKDALVPFILPRLEVVPPSTEALQPVEEPEMELEDSLTPQADALYNRWWELAKILYEPTVEPPHGISECVMPLLRDSSAFLGPHHEVMTRFLGRTTAVNELPGHVARTVLLSLLAVQEAGATSEHCVGMAMAALFHDLAMVPRTSGDWKDIGSEVGRLSADLMKKIPGLSPQITSMAEQILIGMDEFPMDVWQNVPRNKVLEPLAKLLWQTDRFEKVMQKQKSRITRRLNQHAV